MITIYLGLAGLLIFYLGSIIQGTRLRRQPSKENAEKFSRVIHFLFFTCLGPPFVLSVFIPGVTRLDGLVGLPALPYRLVFLILGVVLAVPGLYLMGASNLSLRRLGSGANAFRLTTRIVELDVYRYTRNPMSLGYYLLGIALGFLSGSSLLTLYVLLGIIPAHLFCLKFFEELELQLRFGEEYARYKQSVPFLFPRLTPGAR